MTQLCLYLAVAGAASAAQAIPAPAITFHQDVVPILQKHCQGCHKTGDIGPMPLVSYQDVKPRAAAIQDAVKSRRMPPWLADPKHGAFSNDPRLSDAVIKLLDDWVASGAPEGKPPHPRRAHIPQVANPLSPDIVVAVPKPILIPANKAIERQYVILPLPFTFDRWVRAVEVRPSDRTVVDHIIVYVRERGSEWLRDVPHGEPYPAGSSSSQGEILAIYTPASPIMICPDGMARKVPTGADLVLELHYRSKQTDASDQTQVGLVLASAAPSKRVLTLQMGQGDLRIAPGQPDYQASVTGTLPRDTLLLSLFPHMHLRGAAFNFDIVNATGHAETLLKVNPFRSDLAANYVLKTPRLLPKGTVLKWTGHFDNSANNPRNPDPKAAVTWGEQLWQEVMIGFFDVAVDPGVDKGQYFARQ